MEKEKDPAYRLFGLALAYDALGRKPESDANMADLITRYHTTADYQIAEVYAAAGRRTVLSNRWSEPIRSTTLDSPE